MSRLGRVRVFGPAYLDRVVRVDAPLIPREQGGVIDRSYDGSWSELRESETELRVVDLVGREIVIERPSDWPVPGGTIRVSDHLGDAPATWTNRVRGVEWLDDLGGMGAGFAAALGGSLTSALGPDDPIGRVVSDQLADCGIDHRPIVIPGTTTDWTLLISSGPFGDKLPIGFRGCHAALDIERLDLSGRWDVLVVAALPNRLAGPILRGVDAEIRVFAPAMRNMLDRDVPVASLVGAVDLFCCNRREWESQGDPSTVTEVVPLISITDGPAGARLLGRDGTGRQREWTIPVFPRRYPPRDTNRAGEAFASALVASLRELGWRGGPMTLDDDAVQAAGRRASAAAALVLDRPTFGFATEAEIDAVLVRGL